MWLILKFYESDSSDMFQDSSFPSFYVERKFCLVHILGEMWTLTEMESNIANNISHIFLLCVPFQTNLLYLNELIPFSWANIVLLGQQKDYLYISGDLN